MPWDAPAQVSTQQGTGVVSPEVGVVSGSPVQPGGGVPNAPVQEPQPQVPSTVQEPVQGPAPGQRPKSVTELF